MKRNERRETEINFQMVILLLCIAVVLFVYSFLDSLGMISSLVRIDFGRYLVKEINTSSFNMDYREFSLKLEFENYCDFA